MPLQDIAKWIDDKKALSGLRTLVASCVIGVTLSGCMGAGLDFAKSVEVDKNLATGSVNTGRSAEGDADALTVRDAVTTADVSKVAENPIPWANSASGSAGVISSITEEQTNGTTCRRFTTTRHSYQGIAKFEGNTCKLASGEWYITSFAPRS